MKKAPIALLFAIAAVVILLLPATTSAIPLHVKEKVPIEVPQVHVIGTDPIVGEVETTKVVERVVHVAPADTDDDGCRDSRDSWDGPGCEAPPPPPEPEPVSYTEPVYEEPTYEAPATSSGGCPSYMAGEASSPDAVNPTSGAAGCYQVLPSTAAAMGSACADVNSTSCVSAICAAQGDDAWVAADPCGYVGRP